MMFKCDFGDPCVFGSCAVALQDSSRVSWLLAFFVLGTSYLVPSPRSGLVLLWAAFWRRPDASELAVAVADEKNDIFGWKKKTKEPNKKNAQLEQCSKPWLGCLI